MTYNAVTFLEGLFRASSPSASLGPASDGLALEAEPSIGPEDLPSEWRIDWEERAAIMEYDGGLSRERAEARALEEIVREMKRAGIEILN